MSIHGVYRVVQAAAELQAKLCELAEMAAPGEHEIGMIETRVAEMQASLAWFSHVNGLGAKHMNAQFAEKLHRLHRGREQR